MQYICLGEYGDGVRLSINVFPKMRTPEIDKLLGEYVSALQSGSKISSNSIIKSMEGGHVRIS